MPGRLPSPGRPAESRPSPKRLGLPRGGRDPLAEAAHGRRPRPQVGARVQQPAGAGPSGGPQRGGGQGRGARSHGLQPAAGGGGPPAAPPEAGVSGQRAERVRGGQGPRAEGAPRVGAQEREDGPGAAQGGAAVRAGAAPGVQGRPRSSPRGGPPQEGGVHATGQPRARCCQLHSAR